MQLLGSQNTLAQHVLFTLVILVFSPHAFALAFTCLWHTMAHSWVTNFLLCMPLLFLSGSTTILTLYFVSAVSFSLLCSPFPSHFLFQKLLSKSLLSFSQLINLPFTFPSPHLSSSTCPWVFLWNIHKWAAERLRAEHPWRRRSGGPGMYGWEPEGSGNQFSHLSYSTPPHSALFLPVSCRHMLYFTWHSNVFLR